MDLMISSAMVRDRMALPEVADNEAAIVSAIRAAQQYLQSALDSEFSLSETLVDTFYADEAHFGVVPSPWFNLRLRRMMVREDLLSVVVESSESLSTDYVVVDPSEYVVDADKGIIKIPTSYDLKYIRVTYQAGHSPVLLRQASPAGSDVVVISASLSTNLTGWAGSPIITFSGGGAYRQATGVAVMAADVITDITIIDGGSGYTSSPTITATEGVVTSPVGGGVIAVNTSLVDARVAQYDYSAIPDWLTTALIDLVPVVFNIGPTTERAAEAGPIYDKVEKFVRFTMGPHVRPVGFCFRPIKKA